MNAASPRLGVGVANAFRLSKCLREMENRIAYACAFGSASQMPFGFQSVCEFVVHRRPNAVIPGSQMPFGFQSVCEEAAKKAERAAMIASQMPFGFQSVCEKIIDNDSRVYSSVANAFRLSKCLRVHYLIEIGGVEMNLSQMPFGFQSVCEVNTDALKSIAWRASQMPFGFQSVCELMSG